ncbi:Cys-tRNA(Pro) deacylase [Isoptericola variabilis]|uniref:Cys-tRNA(Pro)/Cys-tRNA(Cys) deacylase n=1 Tax=Isoptericola variabilis (strain 225) TaxID=743718 RepID=F6FQI7_ISOV2|nr:Cys-tRNA(Pro) deacylase [Isoptericola variabilis]AEG44883.1 ybaK/ebsC protein [Isoptericola variabilis 225]
MAKKKAHASHGTPAVLVLEREGVPHTLHAYEHDPSSDLSYGLEAARAIGVDPAQVFKTLLADVDGALVVGIVPVAGTLDLKALARAVAGKRAVMADPAAAQRATGYVVGGISPLGQRTRHPTVLDSSAEAFDVVYVSGGRRGLDVGIAPADLLRLTDGRLAPIGRG